jgi:hypothetical protein
MPTYPNDQTIRDALDLIEHMAETSPPARCLPITSSLNELCGAVDEGRAPYSISPITRTHWRR